jgi:hypothetical protein
MHASTTNKHQMATYIAPNNANANANANDASSNDKGRQRRSPKSVFFSPKCEERWKQPFAHRRDGAILEVDLADLIGTESGPVGR